MMLDSYLPDLPSDPEAARAAIREHNMIFIQYLEPGSDEVEEIARLREEVLGWIASTRVFAK